MKQNYDLFWKNITWEFVHNIMSAVPPFTKKKCTMVTLVSIKTAITYTIKLLSARSLEEDPTVCYISKCSD